MLKSWIPVKQGGSILAIGLLAASLSLATLGQAPSAAADGLSYTMLFVQVAPDAFPSSAFPQNTGMFLAWTKSTLADPPAGIAFVFDWGDGTTTRDPPTGYRYPYKPGQFVLGNTVFHTFRPGTYTLRVTAVDELGNTQVDPRPTVLTVPAR